MDININKNTETLISRPNSPPLQQKPPNAEPSAEVLSETPPISDSAQIKALLTAALQNAGLKITDKNIQMLEQLFENNMPVNKETVLRLNQAVKMMGGDVGKAVFFLKNDMPPSTSNTNILNSFINHEFSLSTQLTEIADTIANLPEGDLKNRLLTAFLGEAPQNRQSQDATAISQPPQGATPTSQTAQSQTAFSVPMNPDGTTIDVPALKQTLQEMSEQMTDGEFFQEITNMADNLSPNQKSVMRQVLNEILPSIETFTADINAATEQSPPTFTGALENSELLGDNLSAMLDGTDAEFITNREPSNRTLAGTPPPLDDELEMQEQTLRPLNTDGKTADNPQNARQAAGLQNGEVEKNQSERIKSLIMEKYSFEPSSLEQDDIDKALNDIKKVLTDSIRLADGGNSESLQKLTETMDDINKHIDFLNNMKHNIFVQIPVAMNGQKLDASLYVFKDRRKKTASGNSASALLALDLLELGHIEAYVQKSGKSILCQFRLTKNETEQLFKANISSLSEKLSDKGFRLDSILYKQIEESFTVIDAEPKPTGELQPKTEKPPDKRRLYIDVMG